MLIIMTFAVLILYAALIRHMGKTNRVGESDHRELQQSIQTERSTNITAKAASVDSEVAVPAWTALDDLQLNRLLKESF